MGDIVDELTDRARHSTYSTEREDAIEKLGSLYGEVETDDRAAICRTLEAVAREATHGDDRSFAREQLIALADTDEAATETAITTLCRVAIDGRTAEEREGAIDRLRDFVQRGVAAGHEDQVRPVYLEIMDEATRSAERQAARNGFAELAGLDDASPGPLPDELEVGVEIGEGGDGTATGGADAEANAYLAVSLADHLRATVDETASDCRRRAEELQSFISQFPVDDEAYGEVLEALSGLIDQLDVVADPDDALDAERQDRVERIADRVETLYLRAQA